jgi:hypothetical protein
MPTPLFNTGFEHGLYSESGGGLFGVHLGNVPVVQFTTKHTGTYALQCDAVTGLACAMRTPTFASQTRLSIRFWYFYSAAPSTSIEVTETALFTNTWMVCQLHASGQLQLGWIGGTSPVSGSAVSISAGAWHLVEITFDGNTTSYTARLKVDGVTATDATLTGGGVAAITNTIFGVSNAKTLADTRNTYFDDCIVGSASGITDFWGDGKGIIVHPGADGSHSVLTAGFIDGDTKTTPNFTNSTTTAWTFLDKFPWVTARSTTNNVSCQTHANGAFLEIAPDTAQVPSGEQNANAVRALLSYSSVTATANGGSATVVRNSAGAQTDIFGNFTTGVDMSETTNFFKGAMVTKPAGEWTETEIQAVRWRIGRASNSTDVSPRPTWQALALEIDYPVSTAPPEPPPASYKRNRVVSSDAVHRASRY